MVVFTEGMQCRLRLHVVNDGWSEISVASVSLGVERTAAPPARAAIWFHQGDPEVDCGK